MTRTQASAKLTLEGTIRQVGARTTLDDVLGNKWCLVGGDHLTADSDVKLQGTVLGGQAEVSWFIVDPVPDTVAARSAGQALSRRDDDHGVRLHPEREFRRVGVAVDARLVLAEGSKIPVSVTDLSYTGCQVHGRLPDTMAGTIAVDLPPIGPVLGRVAWLAGDKAGLQFLKVTDVRRCVQGG